MELFERKSEIATLQGCRDMGMASIYVVITESFLIIATAERTSLF
jgi:hypothetical protein